MIYPLSRSRNHWVRSVEAEPLNQHSMRLEPQQDDGQNSVELSRVWLKLSAFMEIVKGEDGTRREGKEAESVADGKGQ